MTMGELETVVRETPADLHRDHERPRLRQHPSGGARALRRPASSGSTSSTSTTRRSRRGFGIALAPGETGDELARAMKEILASGAAGLVDARIDPAVNAWTHPLLVDSRDEWTPDRRSR